MATGSRSLRRAQVQTRTGNEADCPNHPGVKVIFVCLNSECLEQLACTQCVSTNHRRHNIEDLTKFAANKRKDLHQHIQQARTHCLRRIKKSIEHNNVRISSDVNQSEENALLIHKRQTTLKNEIDTIAAKLTQLGKQSAETNKSKLTQHKVILEKLQTNYQSRIQNLEEIYNNGSDTDVIHVVKTLPLEYEETTMPDIENLTKYQPVHVPSTAKHLYFTMGVSPDIQQHQASNCLTSFEVPCEGENSIKYLCPIMDQVLVWFWNSRKASIYNRSGLLTHSIQLNIITDEHNKDDQNSGEDEGDESCDEEEYMPQVNPDDIELVDLFVSPVDFSIWYCSSNGKVQQITNNGEYQLKFATNQQLTAICISQSGNIVLGTTSSTAILYNQNGNVIKTSENLEWCARKIVECPISGNFAILKSNANVNVMDKSLNLIYMFRHSVQLESCPFKPVYSNDGICFDREGNLFIADKNNQSIISLDSKGKYQRTLVQEDNEQFYPYAVCVVCEGSMWVAYRSPVIHENYLQMTRKVLKLIKY